MVTEKRLKTAAINEQVMIDTILEMRSELVFFRLFKWPSVISCLEKDNKYQAVCLNSAGKLYYRLELKRSYPTTVTHCHLPVSKPE